MANVILTFKVMPESPAVDMKKLEQECSETVKKFGSEVGKFEIEPIAFGLKALKMFLVLDEKKGSPDALEESLRKVKNVQSVEITDVRRAIG